MPSGDIFTDYIYDHDATLVNTFPAHYRGVKVLCQKCGVEPPPMKTMGDWLQPPYEESFQRMGVVLPTEKLWKIYHSAVGKCQPKLFPGVITVLRELKRRGKNVHLLTANDQTKWVLDVYRRHGIEDIFDSIVVGCSDKREGIALILEASRKGALMVGDSVSDIRAAVDSGIVPIGFKNPYGNSDLLIKAGARKVLSHHREIFEFVK